MRDTDYDRDSALEDALDQEHERLMDLRYGDAADTVRQLNQQYGTAWICRCLDRWTDEEVRVPASTDEGRVWEAAELIGTRAVERIAARKREAA